jgi:hypothetical protein
MGQSGKSVDQITGLKCKDVFNGSLSTITTNRIGGTGGSAPTNAIACDPNQALHGFKYWAGTNLDGLTGVCLNGDSGVMGNNQANGAGQHVEDNDNWVSSVTGATSSNNVIANFGYDTRNFTQMKSLASDASAGMDCCIGNNTSPECADAKSSGGLDCGKIAEQYCSQGDSMWTTSPDDKCSKALSQGKFTLDWLKQTQLSWCSQSANFNTAHCMQLCTAGTGEETASGFSPSIKTQCNTIYETACAKPANKGLDICSCLWDWTEYPQDLQDAVSNIKPVPGVPEPRCYWPTCVKAGYKKDVLKSGVCPACISSQTINIINNNAAVGAITQQCNNSSTTSSASSGTAAAASNSTSSTGSGAAASDNTGSDASSSGSGGSNTDSSSNKTVLYAGIGAGVLLVLVLVAVAAVE